MKTVVRAVLASAIAFAASAANAGTINFIDLIQNPSTGYGEGAWTALNLSVGGANMTVTGHASNDNDAQQYAYLDWGNAGLGTCKDASNLALVDSMHAGSGANNCAPSSDDNVTSYEFLRFSFDRDVVIDNFWFNNNHDGGFAAGDKVSIGGSFYDVATGYAGGANGIGSFAVNAGQYIDVAYYNQEFYISGMEVHSVPEPATLALMGIGLVGFGVRRRLSA